jgi:outer membrane lipopolysaccharide assembly protein LptE/RlpB
MHFKASLSCIYPKHCLSMLLLSLFLSACGFTLQGSSLNELSTKIPLLNLQYSASNELGRMLRNQLLLSGVELNNSDTSLLLQLEDEQTLERVVSVNRNIRVGEYELNMLSAFQLFEDGEVILDSGRISLFQFYEADPLNAAAKISEAELIKSEMRQELLAQILRQLQAFER